MGLFSGVGKTEKGINSLVKEAAKCIGQKDYLCVSWYYDLAAKLAMEKGDYQEAIKYFILGAEYAANGKRFFNSGWLYRQAAMAAEKANDFEKVINLSLKAAEQFVQADSKYAAQWAYNTAAKAAEGKGSVYQALRMYKKSLEILESDEVKTHIERLIKKAPHPVVLELADKKQAKEGEDIEFRIIIENNGAEPMKNVRLLDKYDNVLDSIDWLNPHEEQFFSYKSRGKVGLVKPTYTKLLWENVFGDELKTEIKPISIKVAPNVEIITSINPALRFGKQSDFVIMVKNKSLSPIKKVKVEISFPDGLKVKPLTKTVFESIGPVAESGCVYAVTPMSAGSKKIERAVVKYSDEFGIEYEDRLEPIVLAEVVGPDEKPLRPVQVEHAIFLQDKKKNFNFEPNPISEEEYVKLAKELNSAQIGYSLNAISAEKIEKHIIEACDDMTFISSRSYNGDKIFLFSGKRSDDKYLLTAVIKQENNLANILFKFYSTKKEGLQEMVKNIANLVEYTAMVMDSAKEIQKIEVNEVVNIIDSIVQRSNIGASRAHNKETTIRDSVVQRGEV